VVIFKHDNLTDLAVSELVSVTAVRVRSHMCCASNDTSCVSTTLAQHSLRVNGP